MRRTSLLFVVCSITLALTAGEIPAQDSSSGILFTGCPEAIQGSHCDSMFFQVVAVDLSTGKQCPEMKYILVDGPGEINQKTGLWQFHPEKEDLDWEQPGRVWTDEVEIAAYKGNDTTTSDENCRFSVWIRDHSPVLVVGNYQQLKVSVGDTLAVPLMLTDEDWCDEPQVDSVRFADSAYGFFAYDPESQIVTFVPDSADAGKHFDVYLIVSSGPVTRHCTLHITVAPLMPTYVVRTGFLDDQIQGQYCDVPITLERFDPAWGMGGFDFLVAYDASALLFQMALEGDLYDECAWEYFTYRYGAPGNCDSSCPSGLLRIIGLAETNNGAAHPNPGCAMTNPGWVYSVPITLAHIRFLVSNDRTLEGAFLPIRFFWVDCGDNVIGSTMGERTFLSHDVYDLGSGSVITGVEPFPTYRGTQDECVIDDPNTNKYALRAVDFYNGGIDVIGVDTVLTRGDINFNQIRFEVADAVMFSNYFVYGLSSFDSHVDQSVFASDVTMDRHYLTPEDLVYLVAVIVGSALPDEPGPPPSPTVAAFFWDQSINRVVSFTTPDTLGAICLVAEGEFTPYLLAAQMEMKYALDSGLTRILVWSLDGHAMTSGNVLAIPGATDIISIETATYDGRMVTTSLEIIGEDTTASYAVRIGTFEYADRNQIVEVPVTLEKFDSDEGLGGFDFLIGFDASMLTFQLAYQGELYDTCAWEYFTYRYGTPNNCDSSCPSGVLRLIGLAETVNGEIHPNSSCAVGNPGWVSSAPVILAYLRFLTADDRTLECQGVPLRFLWGDCGDNALSNADGSETYLSASVIEYNEYDISGAEAFPTYRGAQEECVYDVPSHPVRAIRRVDFYNGWMDFLCDFPFETYGDINLNGIAYEIGDAVMFVNYFVQGIAAFGGHVDASVAQSDVNRDGLTLTIEDLVYLIQVLVGDALPYDHLTPSPNVAHFIWNHDNDVLSLSTPDTLGAVYVRVEGEITPALLARQMEIKYYCDSGITKILVYSMQGTGLNEGYVLSIPGATGILSVQAATVKGFGLVTAVHDDVTSVDGEAGELPIEYALHGNYPNPFNPVTTIAYDLPERADVVLTVYNVVGQKVCTLVDRVEAAGRHEVFWDGRDESGQTVSSGIYLYRITAGEFTQSRKMLLLK